MVSEERVTPQTPNIQRSSYHILSVMIWDVMMPLLGKDYTPFEKQDTRIAAFGQSIPIWVQKEILCIPYQKNITCC
jgi:hypothetical protein